MNLPRSVGLAFKAGLLGLLLVVCLGSEYLRSAVLPWSFLNQAQAEVFATLQAPDVQWLIVICISVYLVGFIWLLRPWNHEVNRGVRLKTPTPVVGDEVTRLKSPCFPGRHAEDVRASSRRLLRFNQAPWRDVPLVVGLALYAIASLAYSLNYEQASRSTDALLFFFGIMLFFGFRFWRAVEAKRSQPFNLAGVVFGFTLVLLSISAVWRPESFQNFQYRGQARWSGLWANPNMFGMLMGVGVVLAIGQAALSLESVRLRNASARQEGQSRSTAERGVRSAEWLRWVKVVLFVTAALLCGVGLVKSYSRGAWLGTACGLSYLVWFVTTIRVSEQSIFGDLNCGGLGKPISWLQKNWLPISVILISVLVLAFWNFRHTERLVARRAFSVGNVNDFSWRNRVAAYQGSLQMMAEKPWLGFGWNQPQRVYDQFYRAPKVDEGAAIQMNDFFTLGTALGFPALVCFVAFVGLSLGPKSKVQSPKSVAFKGQDSEELQASDFRPPPSVVGLPFVCRAAVFVLLVGFWFDGGLFKLVTGATFWILLALGKEDPE